MEWFKTNIEKLRKMSARQSDQDKLTEALNFKYGNYDYDNDARSKNGDEFKESFQKVIKDYLSDNKIFHPKIIITGANSGYEVEFLNNYDVTAVDLSDVALDKLKSKYPNIKNIKANIQEVPFEDDVFDVYVSMRAIHSFNVDLEKALKESDRVTKKNALLVYSISNAYLIDGEIVKGMYVYQSESFDLQKPYDFVNKIKDFFNKENYSVETIEIQSEIIIVVKKHE